MKREHSAKKTKRSLGSVLYWTVGCLLILTLVSFWMACGLFAKYTTSDAEGNDAHVAATGVMQFDVWEHELETDPVEVYKLGSDLTKKNEYQVILPGFDLPKDPFVRLELKDSEVDYHLYLQVFEENFPKDETLVQYFIDKTMWKEIDKTNHIYQFIGTIKDDKDNVLVSNGYFDAGNFPRTDILIFEPNRQMIYVSEHYKGGNFNLSFKAWLVQVD